MVTTTKHTSSSSIKEKREQISALKKLADYLEILKASGEMSPSNLIDLEVELKKIKKEMDSLQ
jgi:hypothetical protein